jgi:hypothetical protein
MVHGRLGNHLWPEAARDTSRSYFSDVSLLGENIPAKVKDQTQHPDYDHDR